MFTRQARTAKNVRQSLEICYILETCLVTTDCHPSEPVKTSIGQRILQNVYGRNKASVKYQVRKKFDELR